mmetsp:Transcript_88225/g.248338  ORF Transcript_88225/g.248338 Transcript_88225/m.248338 type:complete len:194 (+) Transcript_88225:88-669(+)
MQGSIASVAGHAVSPVRRSARDGAGPRPKRKRRAESNAEPFGDDEADGCDLEGEEEVDVELDVGEADDGDDASDSSNCEGATDGGQFADDGSIWATGPSRRGTKLARLVPGIAGFRAFAEQQLRKTLAEYSCPSDVAPWGAGSPTVCPPLQLHQKVVSLLLHPRSPITRLLVDQPTGAGKTRDDRATVVPLWK